MAASHEVLILGLKAGTPSLTVPAQLVLHYATTLSAQVRSSLSMQATKCVETAYRMKTFPCVLDHQWDGQITQTAVYDYSLLENENLRSYAQDFNTAFDDVDFEQFETEAQYQDRIKAALFTKCDSAKVIVTHPSVISLCLRLMGSPVVDKPPVFISVRVWPESFRGAVQMSFDDWDEAESFLSKPKSLMSTIPLSTSVIVPSPYSSIPKENSGSISQYLSLSRSSIPRRDSEKMEKVLEEQVDALSLNFSKEVREAVTEVIEENRQRGPDPAEDVISAATQSLSQLHSNFLRDLNSISTRISSLDDFDSAQRREIETLINEFRGIQQQQLELESLLAQTTGTLRPLVDSLKSQLAGINAQQSELRTELEDAKNNKLTKGYPLLIKSVTLGEDNYYYAVVLNRKFYDVHGYLYLFQGEHAVAPGMYCKFTGETRVNLSHFPELACGSVEVAVTHFYDMREISRRVGLTLQEQWRAPLRTYLQCEESLLYRTLGNMQEIEQEFVTMGKGSVETFQRLAAAWRNEDENRVNEFLQIVLADDLPNEAAIRRQLAKAGIIIQT